MKDLNEETRYIIPFSDTSAEIDYFCFILFHYFCFIDARQVRISFRKEIATRNKSRAVYLRVPGRGFCANGSLRLNLFMGKICSPQKLLVPSLKIDDCFDLKHAQTAHEIN